MKGTLYGIGLGPGASELITLKAWRLLSTVEVIAWPQSPSGASFARRIAAPFIPEDATTLAIEIPMTGDRAPAQKAYDKAVKKISRHLDDGRHVAFICNGDPFFYSTFMYIFDRLKSTYEIEIVPGVTSITAAAAAQQRPLAARNDIVKILPATLDDETLKRELTGSGSLIINKVGRHFNRIARLIDGLGLTGRAQIIENASSEYEVARPLSRVGDEEQPYFSTIIIYTGSEDW